MSAVTWLHLSDWHQRGADFDRQVVRDALLEDLRRRTKISPKLEPIDFIVFSGDLAFSGKESEYKTAASEFLEPVLETVQVNRSRLFLVPGNHDLDRQELQLLPPLRTLFRDRKKIVELLSDVDRRVALFQPMRAYGRFVKSFFGDRFPEPAFSCLSIFEVGRKKIALLGMNSAWMSGQRMEDGEVNDYGTLLLGEPQFSAALQNPEVKKADLSIAMMHHPFGWLNDIERRSFVERCMTRGFHFILRGHEHDQQVTIPTGTSGSCALISAGSCYDRREFANGYNFVHVDFESGYGTVFLRRYDFDIGFHKDTVLTGDDTPGYHQFLLPKQLAKPSSEYVPPSQALVEAKLVTDYRDPDILQALDIYDERMPAAERFEAPVILRWLREDQEQRARGAIGPRDYFAVAKTGSRVCGFSLVHYYPKVQLAFIAYLVVEKGIPVDSSTISHKLLAYVSSLFAHDNYLKNCKGFVFEVEDPALATTEETRRERLARIRLFCMLAEANDFTLRGLDFNYYQPPLAVPTESEAGKELPMLLMYAPRVPPKQSSMGKPEVKRLLKFIFEWLYPEGFSDVPEENSAYRKHLSALCRSQAKGLPSRIPTLNFAQIRARQRRAVLPIAS